MLLIISAFSLKKICGICSTHFFVNNIITSIYVMDRSFAVKTYAFKYSKDVDGQKWEYKWTILAIFCNVELAMLVHVKWVKFSSENDTWKVSIELNKHYVGMWTSRKAGNCFSGTTLSRVLAYQSTSSIPKYKNWSNSNPKFNVHFLKDYYR